MLNYIWFALLAIGVVVALGNDVYDEATNRYRNGAAIDGVMEWKEATSPTRSDGELVITAEAFGAFYRTSVNTDVRLPISITTTSAGNRTFSLPADDAMPKVWQEMVKGASTKGRLGGNVVAFQPSDHGKSARLRLEFEPIHFLKMKAVTNASLDIAGVAVNIAIGLIGIMAMWLGVMKVAEEAGLLKVLTRMLAPITRRIFPDVPQDHPALGAIIMNTAANMLGLSNAATPIGLKAMEELNKLNPKVGTATNAMVTFLAINTAGLILIPATAIAVRAAVGSSNPGIIIGTSIVGAGCATIAGITASKLLQRLPRYKKEMEVSNG